MLFKKELNMKMVITFEELLDLVRKTYNLSSEIDIKIEGLDTEGELSTLKRVQLVRLCQDIKDSIESGRQVPGILAVRKFNSADLRDAKAFVDAFGKSFPRDFNTFHHLYIKHFGE